MKQKWIALIWIFTFSLPAFALPSLEGVPEDSTKDSEVHPKPEIATKDRAHQLKKEVQFIELNHYLKKMAKLMNGNVKNICHEEDPKIQGFKSFSSYLVKKEENELLKFNQVNSEKSCMRNAFACSLNGESLKTFSKLIHDPYFLEYLTDDKKWKDDSAKAIVEYFLNVEAAVKPSP